MMRWWHLILCRPLLLPPSVFPSIKVFSSELSLLIRWPKYQSSSFSISPSREYSGLISFRSDWFDLSVQGTLKSLLQHHSLKASVFCCSAVFIVQLLHSYITTEKIIALIIWTFVGKVMSLLFNLFLLACPICWHKTVCGNLLRSFVFLWCRLNLLFHFWLYLICPILFLLILAKTLSILFIFSENHLLLFLIFLIFYLYFIYFLSDFYYFFPPNFGLFFFFLLYLYTKLGKAFRHLLANFFTVGIIP